MEMFNANTQQQCCSLGQKPRVISSSVESREGLDRSTLLPRPEARSLCSRACRDGASLRTCSPPWFLLHPHAHRGLSHAPLSELTQKTNQTPVISAGTQTRAQLYTDRGQEEQQQVRKNKRPQCTRSYTACKTYPGVSVFSLTQ